MSRRRRSSWSPNSTGSRPPEERVPPSTSGPLPAGTLATRLRWLRCRTVLVSARDLRNRTAEVVAAVEAGESVTLTNRGEPVADIVPHRRRAPWLPGAWLGEQLAERVLTAADADVRARPADALALARSADPLPASESVMGAFARLVHDCPPAGARPRVLDALITATAVERGLPVVTQDDGFATVSAAHPRLVVERV